MLRILSLGAGVQSSTMLLMGLRGEFGEGPDAAVFADTGWEPAAVYRHLEWLEKEVSPFPIHRVSAGNIRRDVLAAVGTDPDRPMSIAQPPFYVRDDDPSRPHHAGGALWRKCTRDYKLSPIRRRVRALLERAGERHAEQWIGISLDEAHRMKDSGLRHITNVYPLIDRRLTRHDCLRWLAARGYPAPPKSACLGCPYHSNAQWRAIRDHDPQGWADVLEFDERLREGHLPGVTGKAYLHRSFQPLIQVDLSTAADHGQLDLFGNECEGLCGV
jgi:hypothetical protein